MDSYIIIQIPILVFAVVVHESAHGWMAEKCGDSTARYAGRITLNPIPHIDLFGSIILPMLFIMMHLPPIAQAKPVPVNYYNLHKPKRDMAFVGLAGPLSNLIIASIFLFMYKILFIKNNFASDGMEILLASGFQINLFLAVFNLIPIPPLDGSRLLRAVLPDDLVYSFDKIEPFGILIVILLLSIGLLDKIFYPVLRLTHYLLML